jgi:hypothetical protein
MEIFRDEVKNAKIDARRNLIYNSQNQKEPNPPPNYHRADKHHIFE